MKGKRTEIEQKDKNFLEICFYLLVFIGSSYLYSVKAEPYNLIFIPLIMLFGYKSTIFFISEDAE